MKYKKGAVTLYLIFIVSSLFILLIAAFAAPFGARFSSEVYAIGDDLIQEANETLEGISDASVKQNLQDSFSNALSATENNISLTTGMYQYSWLLFIGLTALIIFLFTRALVETRGGGLA